MNSRSPSPHVFNAAIANRVHVPPGENNLFPLIDQPHLDPELSPLLAGPVIDAVDLELGSYRIVLEYRCMERGLLFQERDHRLRELLRELAGAKRRERHKVKAMDDGPAKSRSFGVRIVVMDRMLVVRERSKRKNVCLADPPRRSRKCLTRAEVLEKKLPGFLHSTLPVLARIPLTYMRSKP